MSRKILSNFFWVRFFCRRFFLGPRFFGPSFFGAIAKGVFPPHADLLNFNYPGYTYLIRIYPLLYHPRPAARPALIPPPGLILIHTPAYMRNNNTTTQPAQMFIYINIYKTTKNFLILVYIHKKITIYYIKCMFFYANIYKNIYFLYVFMFI